MQCFPFHPHQLFTVLNIKSWPAQRQVQQTTRLYSSSTQWPRHLTYYTLGHQGNLQWICLQCTCITVTFDLWNFFGVLSSNIIQKISTSKCNSYMCMLKMNIPYRPPPTPRSHMLAWIVSQVQSTGLPFQRAKKVVSDSSGLVDFAIRVVNSVLNLPDGRVMFFEEFD